MLRISSTDPIQGRSLPAAQTLTYVFLCIFLLLVAYAVIERQRHVRLKAGCRAAFTRIYASSSPTPTFVMAYSYGEPLFQIRFASQADMAADAVANGAFLRAIDDLCKNRGRKRRPFKAERAVFFSHSQNDAVPQHVSVIHCCSQMQSQADLVSPASLISYSTSSRAYGLSVHDGGDSSATISFCPWCGSKLPALNPDLTAPGTGDALRSEPCRP